MCVCTLLFGFLAGDEAEKEFLIIDCVFFLRVSPRVFSSSHCLLTASPGRARLHLYK